MAVVFQAYIKNILHLTHFDHIHLVRSPKVSVLDLQIGFMPMKSDMSFSRIWNPDESRSILLLLTDISFPNRNLA